MANRIIAGDFNGEQVIRVSKPGSNVLDSNLGVDRLVFDSRWQSIGKILVSGKAWFPARSFSDPALTVTVPFGIWLRKLPFSFVYARDYIPGGNPEYGNWAVGSPIVYNDRMEFRSAAGFASFAQDIRYFVMTV